MHAHIFMNDCRAGFVMRGFCGTQVPNRAFTIFIVTITRRKARAIHNQSFGEIAGRLFSCETGPISNFRDQRLSKYFIKIIG